MLFVVCCLLFVVELNVTEKKRQWPRTTWCNNSNTTMQHHHGLSKHCCSYIVWCYVRLLTVKLIEGHFLSGTGIVRGRDIALQPVSGCRFSHFPGRLMFMQIYTTLKLVNC